MHTLKKITRYLLIALLIFILIFFLGTSLLVNQFKPEFENALTEITGVQARISGKIQIKIFPGIAFVINKLELVSNETYLLKAQSVEIPIDVRLFISTLKIKPIGLHLLNPQVFIVKNKDGSHNYQSAESSSAKDQKSYDFKLENLIIENASLIYVNSIQGDTLQIEGMNCSTSQLKASGKTNSFSLKDIDTNAALTFDQVKVNSLSVNKQFCKLVCKNGNLSIQPDSTAFYGGKISGIVSLDFNEKPIRTELKISAENFKIDSLSVSLLKGRTTFEADISFHSFDWENVKGNIEGTVKLEGKNVTLYGFNPEGALSKYFQDQENMAINAAAVLMSGPVSSAFMHSNYLPILTGNISNDSAVALNFTSEWNIKNGLITSQDVAFSTSDYRLAMEGTIDFKNKMYQEVKIAFITDGNCAVIGQIINGTFSQPIVVNGSDLKSNPQLTPDFLDSFTPKTPADCLFFYRGSLPPTF